MWNELQLPENKDILEELTDPVYITHTHGIRSTYAKKCYGPLCKKSERDNGRIKYGKIRAAKGKVVTRFPPTEIRDRDKFLEKVFEWHKFMRKNKLSLAAIYLVEEDESIAN